MPRQPIFREVMTAVEVVTPTGLFIKIRVWSLPDGGPDKPTIYFAAKQALQGGCNITKEIEDVLEAIRELPGVAASEVTDPYGDGIVEYHEWP